MPITLRTDPSRSIMFLTEEVMLSYSVRLMDDFQLFLLFTLTFMRSSRRLFAFTTASSYGVCTNGG